MKILLITTVTILGWGLLILIMRRFRQNNLDDSLKKELYQKIIKKDTVKIKEIVGKLSNKALFSFLYEISIPDVADDRDWTEVHSILGAEISKRGL